MAVTKVQQAFGTSATTTVTATLGATPIQNNLLVAVCVVMSATDPTITGFSTATTDPFNASAGRVRILYKVAGAGESTAIQAASAGATNMDLQVFEYSGLVDASPLDVVANQGANSATSVTSRATGTTATTTRSIGLAVAAAGLTNSSGGGNTWTNSFANLIDQARNHTADLVLSSLATRTSTFSWTTTRPAGGCIATFKGIVVGTAVVNLGGATVTVVALPTVLATAQISLGSLHVTVIATPSVQAVAAIPLGPLTVTAIAKPTVLATALVSLGPLTVTAIAKPTVLAVAQISLGGATVTAVAKVTVPATAVILLGRLIVTALVRSVSTDNIPFRFRERNFLVQHQEFSPLSHREKV